MKKLRATLAIVWRIASPYFRSEDRWAGRILLVSIIAIELTLVGNSVLINQWRSRWYNAMQEHDWNGFVRETIIFVVLAAMLVLIQVCRVYFNQWLQIRWRNWMTTKYLGEWLHDANHYRMQLQGDAADNPDQRVSDDVKMFVEQTLSIGTGLLNSVVTFFSFAVILWGLSAQAPLHLFGNPLPIPGYLVWAALIYAIFGTALTQWIGAPLVNLNFEQQQREADFRFNLVRVRENSEQIALLHGDRTERESLVGRFGRVIVNWYAIMSRTKRLMAFTQSYAQTGVIFPILLMAPAYFANKILLGPVIQGSEAFNNTSEALSFFVSSYRDLAEWRAVVARLDGFEMSIESAAHLKEKSDSIKRLAPDSTREIDLEDLLVRLPNGEPLIAADGFQIQEHERLLVNGPSGAGKSTLFRAIAGIWPFGSGSISVPADASLMMLPQRPYFPIAPLHGSIAYPAAAGKFDAERMREVLKEVGLPQLAGRLDEEHHWNRTLSVGEQQRLGIARALLHAPNFLFLDEATASLDEPSEAALYRLLAEKLPDSTIVSIGHRSTLDAFHQRKAKLKREDDHYALAGSAEGAKP
ncbi:MAG: ABC transporter ATP-binding protein/permease [Bradyrhizobium sp.]|nr:ABC transporter ATP-binding protein/permease [Bradyrhizobium sp.]